MSPLHSAEASRLPCALSSLNANQLSGTIPSSLGNMTGLLGLCVHRAECRHRTVLRRPTHALSYLYANQLSGTIPSSLGSLTRLKSLCVHRAADRHCTRAHQAVCTDASPLSERLFLSAT